MINVTLAQKGSSNQGIGDLIRCTFSSAPLINPSRENIILKRMVYAINDVTAGRKNAVLKRPLYFIVLSFKIVESIRAKNNITGT
jgi:hypothetical protein